ncbi:MAG: FecR domain-containing protein [Burkholderiales bacterium]
MLFRLLIAIALSSAVSVSWALPDATVEGVQLPAWLTRDGKRQPLGAGTPLRSRDEVSTGADARLLLRLADGSVVKLGENASLQLSSLAQRRDQNLLTATLKVLTGAFRFTTDAVLRSRSRRDIRVQFPTVTAGIRGTDIWGKNLEDKEVVVLIEGQISISRTGDAPREMKDPLTYLQAPRSGPASVQAVPAEQLQAWAAETEITGGRGAIKQGGRWKLVIAEAGSQTEALALYDQLRGEGFPVRIVSDSSAERPIFRIRLSGFPNRQEASALGERIGKRFPELRPVVTQ